MTSRRTIFLVVSAISAGLLVGCSASGPNPSVDLVASAFDEGAPPVPPIDQALSEKGLPLYTANCSSCHGVDLAGAVDWKVPDGEGRYPPPPLDSSGHAWHHSTTLLQEIIRDGSTADGSAMVGFGDRLSETEIEAVVEYLRTTWGAEERDFQWLVTWQESQLGG